MRHWRGYLYKDETMIGRTDLARLAVAMASEGENTPAISANLQPEAEVPARDLAQTAVARTFIQHREQNWKRFFANSHSLCAEVL